LAQVVLVQVLTHVSQFEFDFIASRVALSTLENEAHHRFGSFPSIKPYRST